MAHGAARAAGIWANDRTVTEVDYGMYTPTFSILLSNAAWNQITPADQEAIRSVSGSRLAARSASWDFFDHGHRQHMIETGLNIEKASDAVLAELASVTDAELSAWKAAAQDLGVDADAALAAYKAKQDALADRLIFR